MSKTRTEIIEDIQGFMKRHAAPAEHWYIGTAKAARSQLFMVHKFLASDCGLYRQAGSDAEAATVAAFLIKKGTKGDGALRPGADCVYAFKMNDHTQPKLAK